MPECGQKHLQISLYRSASEPARSTAGLRKASSIPPRNTAAAHASEALPVRTQNAVTFLPCPRQWADASFKVSQQLSGYYAMLIFSADCVFSKGSKEQRELFKPFPTVTFTKPALWSNPSARHMCSFKGSTTFVFHKTCTWTLGTKNPT